MKKIRMPKHKPVSVVDGGLISHPYMGEGRFIPSIIIDTSERPDIDDLFHVHERLASGDVASQWGNSPFSTARVLLNMRFTKPMSCEFTIGFIPEKHALLIDAILHAKALYIRQGHFGDNLSTTIDSAEIMAEIPKSVFFKIWDKQMPKIISRRFRAEGLSRQEARKAAHEKIRSMREMWNFRQF